MTSPRILLVLLALLSLAGSVHAQARNRDELYWKPWKDRDLGVHRASADLHMSTQASRLCAKLNTDGTFDSGAVALRFFHGATDEPLTVNELMYAPVMRLHGGFWDVVDDCYVSTQSFATPQGPEESQRLKASTRVAFENPSWDDRSVHLKARLFAVPPGDGLRPEPALPFDESATWTVDGSLVLRNGAPVFYFEDSAEMLAPTLTMHEPGGPDDAICTLEWKVDLPARTARTAAVHLAGPALEGDVDDDLWRTSFQRVPYRQLAERVKWQTDLPPTIIRSNMGPGNERIGLAMLAAVQYPRMLGVAEDWLGYLTDRPYNRPPTDVAVEAAYLGMYVEWGWADFGKQRVEELIHGAVELGSDLSPERRVALLDGLMRATRLFPASPNDEALAEAIITLHDTEAAVPPWSNPAHVRAGFSFILDRAGRGDEAEDLPALTWAEPEEGTAAALMVSVRQALAEPAPLLAWNRLQEVLDRTTSDGTGSLGGPNDPTDGMFGVGMLSLVRAFLLDDWGEDLHIFPGMSSAFMPGIQRITVAQLISRFGAVRLSTSWVRKNRILGGMFGFIPHTEPGRIVFHPPVLYAGMGVQVVRGGEVDFQPDGTLVLSNFEKADIIFNVFVRRRE